MDEAKFWEIVDEARVAAGGHAEKQAKVLASRLQNLPLPEIISFNRLYRGRINRAYRHDLWAAAYIIKGGCSDDGFEYFRAWLVGAGKAVYENALSDPESLVGVVNRTAKCESLMGAAWDAYKARTGEDLPSTAFPAGAPSGPAGTNWEYDELPRKFPKLWARFGETPVAEDEEDDE